MARLVVKLRIPVNLVEDNYYCKEQKKPRGSLSSSNTELDSYLTMVKIFKIKKFLIL